MERVLDVYKRPYNELNPVICMDESPKQLIGETRTGTPMGQGKEKRIDYEYARKGTCNIFMVNEPLNGKRRVKITERKTKVDWAILLKEIADEDYPNAEKITLVMDNFKTHSPGALYETFEPKEAKRIWDKFEFVFTPKHGSWLNMAEIELSIAGRQCLNRRIPTERKLKREIEYWQKYRNENKLTIQWKFTAKDARKKFKYGFSGQN